jgi:hypothetical protein
MKLAWLYWEADWSDEFPDEGTNLEGHWEFRFTRDDYRTDDSKWKRIVYCEVEE